MINRIVYLLLFLLVFSSEIYAATIKDGMNLFNAEKFHEAKSVFEPLAKKGDASALFWLGITQFHTGDQSKAGSTLLEASEKGNPWAMHLMVPSYNGYCDYLGWDCDEAWMDKAINGWKKLAAQGDGKAMYALLFWGDKPWWATIPYINKKRYSELVKKAVYAGGYKAASFNAGFPLDLELRTKLLKYAASKGYAPSMLDLFSIENRDKTFNNHGVEWLKKSVELGCGVGNLVFVYKNKIPNLQTIDDVINLSIKDKEIISSAYYYSLISRKFNGGIYFEPIVEVKNKNDKQITVDLISQEEKKEIEEKAKEFLNKVKPNMFFDESTSVHGLLGAG